MPTDRRRRRYFEADENDLYYPEDFLPPARRTTPLPNGSMCMEMSPAGFVCTEARGHRDGRGLPSAHVAESADHVVARWKP